jgi:ribosome-associated translation inhibitor RaiA
MQTPVEIDFQGMSGNKQARRDIVDHVAKLERRFGRVTSCRVSVKAPSGRHRSGGLYQIHIRLTLPNGREVNVDHTPTADERQSDFGFALNDAFKRARRQLQDHVRQLQGQVKAHDTPSIADAAKIGNEGS